MSTKVKLIITAILALLGSLFTGYIALTDSDDSTTIDISGIVDDAKDVYEAVTYEEETTASDASATTTETATATTDSAAE